AEHSDRLLTACELHATAGCIEIELAQLAVHFHGGEAERLHAGRIEVHADLAIDAAAARDLRDTGNTEQPLRHGVVDEPGELPLAHLRGAHGEIRDRAADHVHPPHDRLIDPFREVAANLRDRIAHVRHGAIDGCTDLEFDIGRRLTLL